MSGRILVELLIYANISLRRAYSYENYPKETPFGKPNYNTRVPENHIWFGIRPFKIAPKTSNGIEERQKKSLFFVFGTIVKIIQRGKSQLP